MLAGSDIPTSGSLTYVMSMVPEFASGDIAALARVILNLHDISTLGLLYHHSTETRIASYDGLNVTAPTMPAWSRNDCITLAVRAFNHPTNPLLSTLQLSYANLSNGDAFVHVAPVSYDGGFTSGTFLQIARAIGGNNMGVRNIRGYAKTLTDAEVERFT